MVSDEDIRRTGNLLSIARKAINGQNLNDDEAETLPDALEHMARIVRTRSLYPRVIEAQEKEAHGLLDSYFKLANSGKLPDKYSDDFNCMHYELVGYDVPRHYRRNALRLIAARSSQTASPEDREDDEWRYVMRLRDALDKFDYYHLRDEGINETIADFATFPLNSLSAKNKAFILSNISFAAGQLGFSLNSFKPMAELLARVANTPPHDGKMPALFDPVVEETAVALAHGVRRRINDEVHQGPSGFDRASRFLDNVKTDIATGYGVRKSKVSAPRARVIYDYIYSKVFDDRGDEHPLWTIKRHPAVALFAKSRDRRIRHDMWRLGNPLKAALVSPFARLLDERRPRISGQSLPSAIMLSQRHATPLAPEIERHYAGRQSRYVIG